MTKEDKQWLIELMHSVLYYSAGKIEADGFRVNELEQLEQEYEAEGKGNQQ